jgi:glycosyltransferase involved in cell wall biosynthesis
VQGAALGAWFGWQQRRWLPRADTVVTVSPELAKRLGGAEVLYNSEPLAVVEAPVREDLRAKLGLGGVVAGYIGALRRRIIEQLLDTAAQVPEVTLLVVGGPPKGRTGYAGLQEQLETYATKVGARAVFTGPLAYDCMGDCYRACDLLLVGHYVAEPLRHAAVPKKLLDAMAYSIPAIVGPYEARRSIVERHRCGLVADEWLAPLRKLAGDSELRREMGLRGAAAWREKYSWDRMEERLLALYAGLLATPEVP